MIKSLPVYAIPKGKEYKGLLPIIKWSIPTDILIEILSLVDSRELNYLCTFDPRCKEIKSDPKQYQRIFIRKIQRTINTGLSETNISFGEIRKVLKLFSNLPESERYKWATLYFRDEVDSRLDSYNSAIPTVSGESLTPTSILLMMRCLKAIYLDKKDLLLSLLKQNIYYSSIYYYFLKYGKEETDKLLDKLVPKVLLPRIYMCEEILIPIRNKWKAVVFEMIEKADPEIIYTITDTPDQDDIKLFRRLTYPQSILTHCYLSTLRNLPLETLNNINNVWAAELNILDHLIFAVCRDNMKEVLDKIVFSEEHKRLSILQSSLPNWQIVEDTLNPTRLKLSVENYVHLLNNPFSPKMIEKIVASAYKNLEINEYLEIIKSLSYVPKGRKGFVLPNYILATISVMENMIKESEPEDDDIEDIKERKEKERIYTKKKQRNNLINDTYGLNCLWKYKQLSPRMCENKRSPHSVYFCNSHMKYKGAPQQEKCIEDILEQRNTNNKLSIEIGNHLAYISQNK